MSIIQNRLALIAAAVLALGIAGCSGGGGSSSDSIAPYLGHWTGSFTATDVGSATQQNGTADITLLSNGTFTGTLNNATTSANGALTGEINASDNMAHLNGTIVYNATGAFPMTGDLSIQNNHLTGQVRTYDTQRHLLSTATVDLARQ